VIILEHLLLCFTLSLQVYAQREVSDKQIDADIHSDRWQVRRNAFELVDAVPDVLARPDARHRLVELREIEDRAASQSNPDLFEDDDYLAYDDKLTALVQEIAVQTHQRRAWDALVNMRFNPDSDYANWMAQHQEALPSVEMLLTSLFVPRRVNAVYIMSEILASAKKAHQSVAGPEYERLKDLIKNHASHDDPSVSGFAIQGLGLIGDREDIPFLNGLLSSIKDEYRTKLVRNAIEKSDSN
jgi:hypothetical protein